MNSKQKSVFNTFIGKEENGQKTHTGRFTIAEMNNALQDAQASLKTAKSPATIERLNNEIVGIAAALVYAAKQGKDW